MCIIFVLVLGGRFYVWASILCSLYRRIRYIEVRYDRGSLYRGSAPYILL